MRFLTRPAAVSHCFAPSTLQRPCFATIATRTRYHLFATPGFSYSSCCCCCCTPAAAAAATTTSTVNFDGTCRRFRIRIWCGVRRFCLQLHPRHFLIYIARLGWTKEVSLIVFAAVATDSCRDNVCFVDVFSILRQPSIPTIPADAPSPEAERGPPVGPLLVPIKQLFGCIMQPLCICCHANLDTAMRGEGEKRSLARGRNENSKNMSRDVTSTVCLRSECGVSLWRSAQHELASLQ